MDSRVPGSCLLVLLALSVLLSCAGCATEPVRAVHLPASARVLGSPSVYRSATGERIEVVHDLGLDKAIVKLPDGRITILEAETGDSRVRYGDGRMALWEREEGATVWFDGKILFNGVPER